MPKLFRFQNMSLQWELLPTPCPNTKLPRFQYYALYQFKPNLWQWLCGQRQETRWVPAGQHLDMPLLTQIDDMDQFVAKFRLVRADAERLTSVRSYTHPDDCTEQELLSMGKDVFKLTYKEWKVR